MRSHGPFSGWLVFIAESVCGTFPAQPCTVIVSGLLREAILRAAAWRDGILNEEQTHIATVICDEIRCLPRARPGLPLPTDQRLLRITREIADNPADNRRLEDWAHWGGISTRTLSRRFIDETGFSFTEWRQRVRLMRALELLAAKIPVTNVAFDLGYETVSAFIAMFHRFFGVTPARYVEEVRRNKTLNSKSPLLERAADIGHPRVRTTRLSSNIFGPE
jgi:AraC-like DNA-binding protein